MHSFHSTLNLVFIIFNVMKFSSIIQEYIDLLTFIRSRPGPRITFRLSCQILDESESCDDTNLDLVNSGSSSELELSAFSLSVSSDSDSEDISWVFAASLRSDS